MDENKKEIGKQVSEILGPIYEDIGHPILKPIGEILSLFPRTLKLLTNGWDKWLTNREQSLIETGKAIEEKLSRIPEEKLCPPESYIAIPAIQQLCYCQDCEELREMYANLLVSSMNKETKWIVHPAFVDLIKQLNPDEARLLRQLKKKNSYPLLDIRLVSPTAGYNEIVVNFTSVGNTVVEREKSIPEYIDNLNRLGIIRISSSYLIDERRYEATIKLSDHLFKVPSITADGWKREYNKHLFELTDFGCSFVDSVFPKYE